MHTLVLLRYAVFAAFVLAVLVALGSWLLRTRRLAPFGPAGRAVRRVTEPLMRPVERRVVRAGGNPVQAGWWLVIGVAVVGVLLITAAEWIVGSWSAVAISVQAGGRAMVGVVVRLIYRVLFLAILVRVVASWLGRGRYTRWLRPVYWLTDWLIEPIRRMLPATGPIDFSPLVALLVLWVLETLVLGVL